MKYYGQTNTMLYVYRLITAGMYRRDAECNYLSAADGSPAIRLCATWWDAQETVTGEIKKLFSDHVNDFSKL